MINKLFLLIILYNLFNIPLYSMGIGGFGSVSYLHSIPKKVIPGVGLVIDTNCSNDKLFNYRITIGSDTSYSISKIYSFNRIKVDNTFGFGVVRTNIIRFWLGPQLGIHYFFGTEKNPDRVKLDYLTLGYGGDYRIDYNLVGPSLGLSLGMNINLPNNFTISFDLTGRLSIYYGKELLYNYYIIKNQFTPWPSYLFFNDKYYNPNNGLWGSYEVLLNVSFLYRINDNYNKIKV